MPHLAHQRHTVPGRCLAESRGHGWGRAGQLQARDLMGRRAHRRWAGSCRGMGAAGWELAGGCEHAMRANSGAHADGLLHVLKP
jgi:hypothetical protein